tara:strand:+ start:206 stop:400 length:195 start_codon:yes stop_codon:yes gene_type:complete
MSVTNRFIENNSDFTNTYEEENIIGGEKIFNDIKKFYWFITFIVFGILLFHISNTLTPKHPYIG